MEALAREFEDIASFFSLWVREAHPGGAYPQPQTLEERRGHARSFVALERPAIPVIVDDIAGSLHGLLGGMPNAVYVIDARGRVAYRASWTDAREIRRVLERQRETLRRIDAGEHLGIPRWSEEMSPSLADDHEQELVQSIAVWEQAENYGEPERFLGPERAQRYREAYERVTGRASTTPGNEPG